MADADDEVAAADNDEKVEAEEHKRPAVAVVYEVIRSEGEHELGRPASALFWSGLAAGTSMSFPC